MSRMGPKTVASQRSGSGLVRALPCAATTGLAIIGCMAKRFCYEYARPAVAADIVVLSDDRGVLLIRRGNEPFKGRWALPGGFMEIDETLADAARRELQEETGLGGVALRPLSVFDRPDRDPRGRVISLAFVGTVAGRPAVCGADDAAEAAWHDLEELPPLAFDHHEVMDAALRAVSPDDSTRL